MARRNRTRSEEETIFAPSPFDYPTDKSNGKAPYADYSSLSSLVGVDPVEMSVTSGELPPENATIEGATIQYAPDGTASVTFGDPSIRDTEGRRMAEAGDHYENLAEVIDETELSKIAHELLDLIDADERSGEPWRKRLKQGLKILGIVQPEASELPFTGASTITHPLIAEAVVQFNARAFPELLPPSGPVKAQILGQASEEKRLAAERVENHMNYQITVEDEGYLDESDQMLFYLPLAGSAFKKTYFDDVLGYTTSRFIRAEDVIIPYNVSSFDTTPRFAIRSKMHHSEVRRYQVMGMWRDIALTPPSDEAYNGKDEVLQKTYDVADGKLDIGIEKSPRHVIYECHVEWDMPGSMGNPDEFKHKYMNASGEEVVSDIPLPYIITIDKESQKVLSITRNWKEGDPRAQRRKYITHYKFLPGTGIYGFGYIHVVGGLAETATGIVRALLDSASFATLQGGFKSKDAKLPAGEYELQPGKWIDVGLTAEELKNAFFTPPFKEPSRALFELLGNIVENGRRFIGTTDSVVGDSPANGPVGTTVALIEQGTKVMSGIHRRLHRAQGKEFRIRAEINAEFLPEGEQIYFHTASGEHHISREDYANGQISVIPVSDPNIVSTQQKIAVAQAKMQLSAENPDLYNRERVHEDMLRALGETDPDTYLNKTTEVPRCDPITEGARVMAGKGVKAFQDQDHEAHYAVHMAQIEFYKTMPDDQIAQQLIMKMMEHLAKHKAYELYNQMQQASGAALPDLDLYADDGDEKNKIPPEIENIVAQMAAQMMAQMAQYFQSRIPPSPADEKKMQIEAEAKSRAQTELQAATQQAEAKREAEKRAAEDKLLLARQAAEQDELRKRAEFAAEEDRKQKAFEAEQYRASQAAAAAVQEQPKADDSNARIREKEIERDLKRDEIKSREAIEKKKIESAERMKEREIQILADAKKTELEIQSAILEVKKIAADAGSKMQKEQKEKKKSEADDEKDKKSEAKEKEESDSTRKVQAEMLKSIEAVVKRLEAIGTAKKIVTIDRNPDGSLVGKVETN